MKSETIDDIVREMRDDANNEHSAWMTISKDEYRKICDRIDAAEKQIKMDYKSIMQERDDYYEEVKRLRAALKPVLEVNPNSAANGHDWALMNINAVREAKRIYNESEVK